MKISMYMLEKWLEKEDPQSVIVEGSCSLSGVRLFEEGGDLRSDCLYVGYVNSPASSENYHNILLMHRNDIIRIKNSDLNYIINRILDAFEYYNTLEQRFFQAYYHENPEQEIISAVEHMLGPCFIMQPDYKILACSQNFNSSEVNIFWESFIRDKEPSLQNIEFMKNSEVMKVFRKNPSMVLYIEPAAAPYKYAVANTYKRSDGSVIGYLVVANRSPITPFEMDMAKILISALNNLRQVSSRMLNIAELNTEGELLLFELLKNAHDQRSRDILTIVNGFQTGTVFRIACLGSTDDKSLRIIKNNLQREFSDVLTTIMDEKVIALFWDNDPPAPSISYTNEDVLAERLKIILKNTSISVGLSNSYEKLEYSHHALDQAEMAMQTSASEQICLFPTIASTYFLSSRSLEQKMRARHPAVLFLEEYDREKGTLLVETMKRYLMFERSIGKTAECMYVHKNTVLYRINQIRELCGIDFDNAADREYLILSLLLS